MKIICFVDSLNSGGAQRQIVLLATLLKKQAIDVTVAVYHDLPFFKKRLDDNNISVKVIKGVDKLSRILSVKCFFESEKPDIVISYLNNPNIICEIVKLISGMRFLLVVSERSYGFGGSKIKAIMRYLLHIQSDVIVINSESQKMFLMKNAPWLRHKLVCIRNAVEYVDSISTTPLMGNNTLQSNFVILARYEIVKQPFLILEALKILRKNNELNNISIDWYGNTFYENQIPTSKSCLYVNLKQTVDNEKMTDVFRLHGPVKDVIKVYMQSSALILPSSHEGCSNVICEAMACGRPVIAGRVGDNAYLVEDGRSGFLFDQKSPEDLAEKMLKFKMLSVNDKINMGIAGRKRACELFSPERLTNEYLNIFDAITIKKLKAKPAL